MSASLSGQFSIQELLDSGAPMVGGRLYTYSNGTTTHKTAYTDKAGTIPHTYTSDGLGGQYIALNARGELPDSLYFLAGSYDVALKTAAGATVWTRRADPQEDAGDLLRADLASTASGKGASMHGVHSTTLPGIERNVEAYLEALADWQVSAPSLHVAPPLFGVIPEYADAYVQAALDTKFGSIEFRPGVYKFASPITWYYAKSNLRGENVTLDFSALTAVDFAIIFGEHTSTVNRKTMTGFKIIGPAASENVNCFDFNSTTQDAFTNMLFLRVTLVDFKIQLLYGNNVSNVHFSNGKFTNSDANWATATAISTRTVMANSGEALDFTQCQFNNLDVILENNAGIAGGFSFSQSSLVYSRTVINLVNPCRVNISQGHIEGQLYTSNWFKAAGNGAIIRIRDSEFWFAGGTVTKEIFYSDVTNVFGGIFIDDCLAHAPTTWGVPYLVDQENQGNVYVKNWRFYDGLPSIPFGRNPGVQVEPWLASNANFASGWSADVGDASTVAVSSVEIFNGNTTRIQTINSGNSVKRFRKYRIISGQVVLGSIYAKTTGFAADGTVWQISALILDENLNTISSGVLFTSSGDLSAFTKIDLMWYPSAPAGAAWIEYYIFGQNQTGAAGRSIYLADMVVNPV